jgi:hypothetical protein
MARQKLPDVPSPSLVPDLPELSPGALAKLRQEAGMRVERLIDFLDRTDGYSADEREDENEHGESDRGPGSDRSDDEPSLGASDGFNQVLSWSDRSNPHRDDREHQDEDGDDLDRQEACELEIYGEADGGTGGNVDDEPSLGSLDGRMSQIRWSLPDRSLCWPHADFEYDEADHEGGDDDYEGGDEER